MKDKLKSYIEPNKVVKNIEVIALVITCVVTFVSFFIGVKNVNSKVSNNNTYLGSVEMIRLVDEEDYDEDSTMCDVVYASDEDSMILTYTYEDYEELEDMSITAYGYETEDGTRLFFDHQDVTNEELQATYKEVVANENNVVFNVAISMLILAISISVVLFFGSFFTTYEKSWFMSIMVLATIVAVLFPEESANGVNGIIIMLLYLADTLFNILCELLISKQSRWNFMVSLIVEVLEIAICVVLMYRFATMVTTLFFWIPIDIISFINWSKHKDEVEDELTEVRRLKGWQEVLVLLSIAVWTIVVGYFLSGLDIVTDFIQDRTLATIITYIDACASAVGAANGLFILFRLREQWIAWYTCAILESIINIVTGQYVLLVLKLGYITNTTYGYIKWSKYINTHKEKKLTLF